MQVRRGMFVLAFTIVQFTVALRVPAAETLSSAAKARKVLDARGSERVAMQVMDAVMTSFRQSMTDLPPDFWTAVRERMHANELIDALVPIYQRNLSDSDLDSLLEFYDSPAGKRYVEKQPVIVRESLQVGQQWAERIVQEAVADLKTKERAPTATSDNAASPAPATPLTGTSSETKARRLLEAMSFDREATQFLDVVFSRLRQLRPDVRPDFWNALRARIHPQELIDLSIPIYQRNLSDDDLDELTRFFTSTAGRHFIEKQPAISEESMQAGQEWARKIVEPALMEVLAKKKQQEEHAAEPGGEMRVAAERGDAKAQRSLGRSYEWAEHGVAKDLAEAAKWYRKAADQGDAQAQYLLASLYARGGAGIPPDDAEAAKWYRKAAEQGHRQAQRELAFAYLIGMGVPRDLEEAAKWNRKAAEQ
ncbi:MAG: DUF2059 domain-containing protein, partial [Thermoanaerobaculia bacterium]